MGRLSALAKIVNKACCEIVDKGYSPDTITMNHDTLDFLFSAARELELYSDPRKPSPMCFIGLGIEVDDSLPPDTLRVKSKVIGNSKMMIAERSFDRAFVPI